MAHRHEAQGTQRHCDERGDNHQEHFHAEEEDHGLPAVQPSMEEAGLQNGPFPAVSRDQGGAHLGQHRPSDLRDRSFIGSGAALARQILKPDLESGVAPPYQQ